MSKSTKTIIVTGASSGIGLGVAESYVNSGANVVLNGRSEDRLVAAAEKLGRPEQTAVVVGDIGLAETARQSP